MKTKIILSLLLAILALASCKKFVEIPPAPKNQITEASQLADSANVMNAVAGVYSFTRQSSNGMPYGNAQGVFAMSHSADELLPATIGSVFDIYTPWAEYNIPSNAGAISTIWNKIYKDLFAVNTIQNTLPNSGDKMSQSFIKQVTGEMKVMRAFYYFDLVNMFGGVPLVLNSDYKTTGLLPRASVSEVYAQIISDLTYAKDNLKAAYPSAGKARPNLYTALTLLSKAHLYTKDYESAYNEADQVIKSGLYSLEPDLNRVFLSGSTEAIWQLPTALGSNEADRFIPVNNTRVPVYFMVPSLLTALGVTNVTTGAQSAPADQRFNKWVAKTTVTVGTVVTNYFYPFKYKNKNANTTNVEDYMFFRLGEVYLIRAEAAARLNNLTQALADVNAIRARAGLPATTATSQTDIIDAIMKERQVELFTEWGNRWNDLRRTGTAGAVLGALRPTFWKPEAALWPIPQSSITLDFNLVQNPGYGN